MTQKKMFLYRKNVQRIFPQSTHSRSGYIAAIFLFNIYLAKNDESKYKKHIEQNERKKNSKRRNVKEKKQHRT